MEILYRILGTRQYLTSLGIYGEHTSKRRKTEEEIPHMFVNCAEVAKCWKIIEKIYIE